MSCPKCEYSKEYLVGPNAEVRCPECEAILSRDISRPSIRASNNPGEVDSIAESSSSECGRMDCPPKYSVVGINLDKGRVERIVTQYSCGTVVDREVITVPKTENPSLN